MLICYAGSSGGVRLKESIAPDAGTVEYCVGGVWQAVCHSNWDYKDAFVVCRQLGLPATGVQKIKCYASCLQFSVSSVMCK